jgi:hypothetical protein
MASSAARSVVSAIKVPPDEQAASGLGELACRAPSGQNAGMNLNIGNLGQTMGLQAAQARLQAGSLQQQQVQNQLNAACKYAAGCQLAVQTNQYWVRWLPG